MGKFDGFLLCSDYDGTLGEGGGVSEENKRAIAEFEKNGGMFTIVSGRHPHYLRQLVEKNGISVNAPLVGYNGAWMVDADAKREVFCGGREDLDMIDFIAPFYERDERIQVISPHTRETYFLHCERGGKIDNVATLRRLSRPPIFALIAVTENEKDAEDVRDDLIAAAGARYEIARSWPTGIEIIPSDAGKGSALCRLRQMTGARVVVAAGDFENDLGMMASADISYAVANALPSLRARAARVTVDFREHAIAAIIKDLENDT